MAALCIASVAVLRPQRNDRYEFLYLLGGIRNILKMRKSRKKWQKKYRLNRLLIETDCPYLTPHPYRGKRNEPAYVKLVAEEIASIKGISFEELAEITTENAKTVFNIKS